MKKVIVTSIGNQIGGKNNVQAVNVRNVQNERDRIVLCPRCGMPVPLTNYCDQCGEPLR